MAKATAPGGCRGKPKATSLQYTSPRPASRQAGAYQQERASSEPPRSLWVGCQVKQPQDPNLLESLASGHHPCVSCLTEFPQHSRRETKVVRDPSLGLSVGQAPWELSPRFPITLPTLGIPPRPNGRLQPVLPRLHWAYWPLSYTFGE